MLNVELKNVFFLAIYFTWTQTDGEEIAFTEWPKIQTHPQILRYGRPKFTDLIYAFIGYVSIVSVFLSNDHMVLRFNANFLVKKHTKGQLISE